MPRLDWNLLRLIVACVTLTGCGSVTVEYRMANGDYGQFRCANTVIVEQYNGGAVCVTCGP